MNIKMAYQSRLKNAKRNIYSGLIKQIVNMILQFVIRTIILYVLGAEYQGISGLFTSILQVLNLSDLGFNAAVTFILYKPIAERDTTTINAIMAYLKKVYSVVGLLIMGIGILLMPFLPKLITGEYPQGINIYILFAIYLLNASISYFLFAYKSTLLTAYQREDVVSNVYILTNLSSKVLQIIILLAFKNYYLYVLILPVGSVINNLFLQIVSKRVLPDIEPVGMVSNQIKKEMAKQIKAVFLNRLCDIARNSFDNIVLSSFFGLITVAIYDNYYYIFSAIYGIIGIIARAIKASVGNSLVLENQEKNYADLNKFTFLFMWVVGLCTICMCVLYQPFMMIWMRGNKELLLSFHNMLLFCLYFYAISMTYTKSVYLEAKGLFWECRKYFVIEAVSNLFLNIILGYYFGITGILIATIVTIILFNFIGGTSILFKCYFNYSPKEFYLSNLSYFACTCINGVITFSICSLIVVSNSVISLVIKLLICLVFSNLMYLLFYCRNKNFQSGKSFVKRLIHN